MMVPCRVEIYKKIDKNNVYQGYENSPYTLHRLVQHVKIDRRFSSTTANATIDIFYAGPDDQLVYYQYGGWGDQIPIIDNFNLIKIYINNKIQFFGVIMNYAIDDEKNVISISCQDMFYKLTRAIDCRNPTFEYKNIAVYDMLKDLAIKAGLQETVVKATRGDNYNVNSLKIKYDTQYSDIMNDAVATSNTRCRCLKSGAFAIEDMYHTYEYSDVPNKVNFDWEYVYTKKIATSNARRGGETLYNRLLVRFDGKTYSVFDYGVMLSYMCNEYRFKEVQTALGDSEEKRFRLANRTFRNDTRDNTTLTLDAVDGNPDLDLGQALRVNLNERIGHYMVTGISTDYSADGGYFDTIDIEGLLPTDYIACEKSTGNYDDQDSSGTNEHFVEMEAGKSKNIIIDKNKANKMAKFNTAAGMAAVEIKCEFDNSNASASLVEPSGRIFGFEGDPRAKDGSQFITNFHKTTTLNNTDIKDLMCSQITFGEVPCLTQIIKMTNPMPGTWVVRGIGVPLEDVGCTLTISVKWTLLNEDADIKIYTGGEL